MLYIVAYSRKHDVATKASIGLPIRYATQYISQLRRRMLKAHVFDLKYNV